MNAYKKKYLGITLFEVMLVLVIASVFIVLGYRQYSSYKLDADLREVLYNVDTLSQAASRYYYANCGNQQVSTAFFPGALNPVNSTPPTNPFPINITNDLILTGYLSATIPFNPLVKKAGAGNGYTVQFNQQTSDHQITTCVDPACTTTQQVSVGTNVDWQIQVSVLLNNPNLSQQFATYLQATCLSTLNASTGATVACVDVAFFNAQCLFLRGMSGNPFAVIAANSLGCPPSTNSSDYNNYMVFVRSPSFPTVRSQEGLWGSKASVYMFTQQFTVNLTNPAPNQYFLCGS